MRVVTDSVASGSSVVHPTSVPALDTSQPSLPRAWLPPGQFWFVAAAGLAADWLTKWAANALLTPGRPVPILGSLVRFTLSYDSRTSLWLGIPGTPHWQQPAGLVGVMLLRLVVALGVVWLAARAPRRSWGYAVGFGLIFACAVGNGDHLAWGTTVNFLDLGVGTRRWPTFNLADAGNLCGLLLTVSLMLREHIAERDALGLRSIREIPSALPASFRR